VASVNASAVWSVPCGCTKPSVSSDDPLSASACRHDGLPVATNRPANPTSVIASHVGRRHIVATGAYAAITASRAAKVSRRLR